MEKLALTLYLYYFINAEFSYILRNAAILIQFAVNYLGRCGGARTSPISRRRCFVHFFFDRSWFLNPLRPTVSDQRFLLVILVRGNSQKSDRSFWQSLRKLGTLLMSAEAARIDQIQAWSRSVATRSRGFSCARVVIRSRSVQQTIILPVAWIQHSEP